MDQIQVLAGPSLLGAFWRALTRSVVIFLVLSFAAAELAAQRLSELLELGLPMLYPGAVPFQALAAALLVTASAGLAYKRSTRSFALLLFPLALAAAWSTRQPLWLPTDLFSWTFSLLASPARSHPLTRLLALLAGASVLFPLVALVGALHDPIRRRLNPKTRAHGSARFATSEDLEAAGLFGDKGFYLGRFGNRHVYDDTDRHLALLAPTGAGKSVGVLTNTLLSNPGKSFVVIDPKGELYERTAPYRKAHGSRIIRFAPLDPGHAPNASANRPGDERLQRWNPLEEIQTNSDPYTACRLLAEALLPSEIKSDHWVESGQNLLYATFLYAWESEAYSSLDEVQRLLATVDLPGGREDFCGHILQTTKLGEVQKIISALAKTPDKEQGSIFTTALRPLAQLSNPTIHGATAVSTFSFETVLTGPPATLYLELPYGTEEVLAPLLRTLLGILLYKITSLRETEAKGQAPVYFLLDETASLGRLPQLEQFMAFLRGYGIRFVLTFQDLKRLTALYGQHQTLLSNCGLLVFYSTQDPDTRRLISELSGDSTFSYDEISRSRSWKDLLGSRSQHLRIMRRPLITPEEAGRLGKDRCLLFSGNCAPALLETNPFFKDRTFKKRST